MIKQREHYTDRIQKLRDAVQRMGHHTLNCVDCHVCKFLREDSQC